MQRAETRAPQRRFVEYDSHEFQEWLHVDGLLKLIQRRIIPPAEQPVKERVKRVRKEDPYQENDNAGDGFTLPYETGDVAQDDIMDSSGSHRHHQGLPGIITQREAYLTVDEVDGDAAREGRDQIGDD